MDLTDPAMLQAGIWGVVVVLLAASVLCWALASRKLQGGEELIPWTPRRPAPWGLIDVGACFFLLIIFDAAALQMAGLSLEADLTELTPAEQTRALLSTAAARVAVAVLGLVILVVRTSSRPDDTGVTFWRREDGLVALAGFLMVAPPIYMMQTVLSRVWSEGAHPLVEMIRNAPTAELYAAACLTAVVAAPIAEEFLLRVVFQGWLEKVAVWKGSTSELLVGGSTDWSPDEDESGLRSKREVLASRPPFWPVVVSSLLFAMMHINFKQPSPDPIPLFFFALALGFVYQRTHRLLPCVLLHMLLNFSSMLVLGLQIWRPDLLP